MIDSHNPTFVEDFMRHSFYLNLLLTLCLIIINLPVDSRAGAFDKYNWIKPGDNVEAGQIYIKISRDIAPLEPATFDGIVMTGDPELDAVADAFGVYRILKTYHMETTPDDPTIPDLSRYYYVYFPAEFGPLALIEAYEDCENVQFAEPVPIMMPCYIPNDTRYRNQWHLDHCNLPDAWDVSHGSDEVVIGIVDSGLDMDIDGWFTIHEDFPQNLWINPEEDIDHDGEITFDDWDGEDNDDNGYIDDFYGWNFTRNSNWPDDIWGAEDGHGTHVAGIASAATDNETGVSGAGFNCKLMITAHFDPQDPDGGVLRAYEGVEYCADNGADVINMSWGRFGGYINSHADAIAYAIRQGAILFAGAGNDSVEDNRHDRQHFYPCAYEGVIGVGASDSDDHKANFSTWGDYTDLIAPGVSILSTFPRNDYRIEQGTSMSSPFAAGIGALMLSVEPDLSPSELLEWMQRTAVDISDLNEDYPGIVYRVDAGYLLQSTKPKWELTEWRTIEVEGDGDGIIERNEVISIPATFSNLEGYADAHNVTVRLVNDDPFIHIRTGEINIGDIRNGEELDLWEDQYPTFHISGNSPIHYTTFSLVVNSDEDWEVVFELPMTIRQPNYLLVDDDNGGNFETFYESNLMERPIVHDMWHIADDGLPSQDFLDSYNYIVWETGNDESPLTGEEQVLISNYLDQDGYLLLSGQYIGNDIGGTDFHQNYLKARHVADDAGSARLSGVEGNPITDGMDVLLIGGGGAGNGRLSPSAMEPVGGAETILTYTGDEAYTGGIYYGGDYHLVYLGFALEAVGDGGRTTSRLELLESILDRFYELGVEDDNYAAQPMSFEMGSPHPNPFNARTSVQIDVPQSAEYVLEVLNLTGRRVAVLHDGPAMPGRHTFYWNAEGKPAGMYLFNLRWTGGSLARKVVLVK